MSISSYFLFLLVTTERIYSIECFLTDTNNLKQQMTRCQYYANWKSNTLGGTTNINMTDTGWSIYIGYADKY